eukprot:5898946-Pleurochrysis_carterae.AAC.1
MPVPDIWIIPGPSRTFVCPAANTIMIAVVASRTRVVVELFRRVRSGAEMCTIVALTLVSEEKDLCCGW